MPRLQAQGHQSGHALNVQVVPRVLGQGAVLAEPGERTVDDALVAGAGRGIVDAQPFRYAGPERFQHHIRRFQQAAHDRAALRITEIQSDAALVPVDAVEVDARVAIRGWIVPGVVAADGVLEFDHVRTAIGQELAAPGAGQQAAEVHDSHTGVRKIALGHVASRGSVRVPGKARGYRIAPLWRSWAVCAGV